MTETLDCLPAQLRGPTTTITRMAAGLSGAGVYRVDAAGEPLVLKIAAADEPLAAWRWKLHIQQLAAQAGLAPRVVHTDEARRAVVSDFVTDRAFFALYGAPRTREQALQKLGRMLRRVHALPLPPDAEQKDPRVLLDAVDDSTLPPFVADAVRRLLAEEPPVAERAPVLSHNDVNPTNLVYDGENLLLLDWDAAGANDPLYDLATICVFLRMDDESCRALLAAYDGEPAAALPARFVYSRRLVAILCGVTMLQLAKQRGYTGAGGETLDSTLSLGEFYQRMRAGTLSPATNDGQWWFGLALVKEGVSI